MPPNVNDYRELIRRLDAFDARIAAELETLRRDAAQNQRSRLTEKIKKGETINAFQKRPKREIQLAEAKVPEGVESVLHITVLARRRSEDEETRALMKKVAALVREETAFNGAFAFVSEVVVDYNSPSRSDARIEIVAREL